MSTHRTPGVYIEEGSGSPPPIIEVETAIPAFVGYTVRTANAATDDLRFKPTLVRSMVDFEEFFGDSGARGAVVDMKDVAGVLTIAGIDDPAEYHPLYFAVRMFFDNGGRRCYVVSVGARSDSSFTPELTLLTQGVEALALEEEVTLLVVPEARSLAPADYGALATTLLAQCARLRNRFVIFDLCDGSVVPSEPKASRGIAGPGHSERPSASRGIAILPVEGPLGRDDGDSSTRGLRPFARNDRVRRPARNDEVDLEAARACFPDDAALMNGAAYYPDLWTTLAFPYVETPTTDPRGVTSNAMVRVNGEPAVDVASLRELHLARYDAATAALREHHVTLSPSGAIAGVYAANDRSRGVWKAPASAALASVFAPAVMLTERQSERLNIDADHGKSINPIRSFPGRGTIVWGARTLAGNDDEWRYVSVRRFLSVIEESIRKSTSWVVFEPNDANTWVKVRGVIDNYLVLKWREGALMGATPNDAFFVRCGIGTTMTGQDIADGRVIIEIGVAPLRPAEFIVLRVSHRVRAR